MFIDASELPDGVCLESDICIVGAGAAGIPLALEFEGRRERVCLMESGGLEADEGMQALNRADNIGEPYFPLDQNRSRVFGGTTVQWAGWCRRLDEIDFEARPWVAHSGWPIGRSELSDWWEKALGYCELGGYDYDLEYWERHFNSRRLPIEAGRIETRIYLKSPPSRFGELYRERLGRAANIDAVLDGSVLKLETDEHASQVTGALAGTIGGKRFGVRARHYVLAAGGIENARLLLLSNDRNCDGLGNDHDQVGRYFMEHYFFPSGAIRLNPGVEFNPALYLHSAEPAIGRLFLNPKVQEEERILNYCAGIDPVYGDSPLRSLARGVRRRLWGHGGEFDPNHPFVAQAAWKGSGERRKYLRLHHIIEQAPNPESRVTLGDETDSLGQRKIRMDWRTSPLDRRTFLKAIEIVGSEFERTGIGRLQIPGGDNDRHWPPRPLQGLRGHHMGTTRMSDSPATGVVDRDCRVHGVGNLFIAGSSLFPTAGAGTPTLTIIALALRLAGHLKKILAA